jgi:futalosine hydrolase
VSETEDPVLVLICSVALEAEPVLRRMQQSRPCAVGRKMGAAGRLAGVPVLVLAAGMGKVNAAHGLTAVLERHPARGVVGFGVGGAYPGSGLSVGELALAESEIYGDEGVEAPQGWISTEGIGIPLVEREGRRTFNEFRLDAARVRAAERALTAAGTPPRAGPFVTVSTCSGTARRGAELAARFGAICESMEGAAFAHVAALYGAPLLEVRGISNAVEDRDLSRWDLSAAAEAAAGAVETITANYEL